MLVVMGMLAILMASSVSGLATARRQAMITKANTEIRQLVSAWLAYDAIYNDWPSAPPGGGSIIEATEDNLIELLGKGTSKKIFLNAPMTGSPAAFRDPWGMPYQFRIKEVSDSSNSGNIPFTAVITFPNRNRVRLENN
jgi:type II secretory pathway pseudopilin PulG